MTESIYQKSNVYRIWNTWTEVTTTATELANADSALPFGDVLGVMLMAGYGAHVLSRGILRFMSSIFSSSTPAVEYQEGMPAPCPAPAPPAAEDSLAPELPYTINPFIGTGIWNPNYILYKTKNTIVVGNEILDRYFPSGTITVNGINYVCDTKAEEAVQSMRRNGHKYYPAYLEKGIIWVAVIDIQSDTAKMIIRRNDKNLGIFASKSSYAQGLCAGLGGAEGPESGGAGEGWWWHYHARNYRTAHCWYAG